LNVATPPWLTVTLEDPETAKEKSSCDTVIGVEVTVAVSYTHLDVYKRQERRTTIDLFICMLIQVVRLRIASICGLKPASCFGVLSESAHETDKVKAKSGFEGALLMAIVVPEKFLFCF